MPLVYLLDNDKVIISKLTKLVSNYQTLEVLLNNLETARLIKIERVKDPYKHTYVRLTETGLAVARSLQTANEIVMRGWEIIRQLETDDERAQRFLIAVMHYSRCPLDKIFHSLSLDPKIQV